MELDEILKYYENGQYPIEDRKKLTSDILNWIKEKLPKEIGKRPFSNRKFGFDGGWNMYRQQALKNLGIKEE